MKRRMRVSVLALLFASFFGALGWLGWTYIEAPPMIPYESWLVPHDPTFPLSKTDTESSNAHLRKEDILSGDDFLFTMGVGSGSYGLDVFQVDAKGVARYVFSTGYGDWWAINFNLAPSELTQLRQLLVEVDYGSLASGYHAAVADGTQWCIRVDAAGATKKVYCNNYFPAAAERLANVIGQEVLPAHESRLKKARRIWRATAKNAAAGLWR